MGGDVEDARRVGLREGRRGGVAAGHDRGSGEQSAEGARLVGGAGQGLERRAREAAAAGAVRGGRAEVGVGDDQGGALFGAPCALCRSRSRPLVT